MHTLFLLRDCGEQQPETVFPILTTHSSQLTE